MHVDAHASGNDDKRVEKSQKLMKGFQPVKGVKMQQGWIPLKNDVMPTRLLNAKEQRRKQPGKHRHQHVMIDPALGNYFGQPIVHPIMQQQQQQYVPQHLSPFQVRQHSLSPFYPGLGLAMSSPSRSLFQFRPQQSAYQPDNWLDSEFLQLSAMQDENKPQHVDPPGKEIPTANADTGHHADADGKEKKVEKHKCCGEMKGHIMRDNQFDDHLGNPFNGIGHEAHTFMPGHHHPFHAPGHACEFPFPPRVPFYFKPKLALFRRPPQVYWG
jgi:hypothetical protein